MIDYRYRLEVKTAKSDFVEMTSYESEACSTRTAFELIAGVRVGDKYYAAPLLEDLETRTGSPIIAVRVVNARRKRSSPSRILCSYTIEEREALRSSR